LIERIKRAKFFEPIIPELEELLKPETFIGRSPEQVESFYQREVSVALEKYVKAGTLKLGEAAELHV
jgi:adenylosuccinate lyase